MRLSDESLLLLRMLSERVNEKELEKSLTKKDSGENWVRKTPGKKTAVAQ